jgi:hypothetical protein
MSKKKKKKIIQLTTNYGAISGSEEEAYFRTLSPCRNCSHIRIAHYREDRCLDAILTRDGKYSICGCREWTPSDNLEYLEFMSEKNNASEKKKK